jgi:hypothetical protein
MIHHKGFLIGMAMRWPGMLNCSGSRIRFPPARASFCRAFNTGIVIQVRNNNSYLNKIFFNQAGGKRKGEKGIWAKIV